MRIRGEHVLASRECAHQHQQRGFGQMEVRHHGVDELELEAWADEEAGFAGPNWGGAYVGGRRELPHVKCRRFERPNHSGPYCHDSPTCRVRALNCLPRRGANRHPFGVHLVRIEIVRAQRLKRPPPPHAA